MYWLVCVCVCVCVSLSLSPPLSLCTHTYMHTYIHTCIHVYAAAAKYSGVQTQGLPTFAPPLPSNKVQLHRVTEGSRSQSLGEAAKVGVQESGANALPESPNAEPKHLPATRVIISHPQTQSPRYLGTRTCRLCMPACTAGFLTPGTLALTNVIVKLWNRNMKASGVPQF